MDDEEKRRVITYSIPYNDGELRTRSQFTPEEKAILRPIAETLAMLDGNAFFSMGNFIGHEIYESYLGLAYVLFTANGGMTGHAGQASWIKPLENPIVKEAWNNFQIVKALAEENK